MHAARLNNSPKHWQGGVSVANDNARDAHEASENERTHASDTCFPICVRIQTYVADAFERGKTLSVSISQDCNTWLQYKLLHGLATAMWTFESYQTLAYCAADAHYLSVIISGLHMRKASATRCSTEYRSQATAAYKHSQRPHFGSATASEKWRCGRRKLATYLPIQYSLIDLSPTYVILIPGVRGRKVPSKGT